MATRLTAFSKLLITLLILAAIVALGWFILNKTSLGEKLKEEGSKISTEETSGTSSSETKTNKPNTGGTGDDGVLDVQLVTWGGYAPGLYFNEGAQANTRSRFYKDYGFKVNFVLENNLDNALSAWMAGEYDVLVQTADAFPLYTSADAINEYKPKAFMQVDWSRGGDAIIAKRGINSINDLKGKKVAVAVPSPAQTLLITALEAAGLKYSDVQVVKSSDNLVAAQTFRSDDIDAAVVWSPDDIIATRDVAGSKILLTTEQQSHIIADIMFAKGDFINNNKDMINGFYEGWMRAVREITEIPENQKKAAKYLAEMNSLPEEDAAAMMTLVHWTSHGDNANFFGTNPSFKGQKGQDLYSKMSQKFVEIGDAEKVAPTWRSAIYTGAVQAANAKLGGAAYGPEKIKSFDAPTQEDVVAAPIATKPVSINFSTGQSALTENAKTIIDLQFADVARSFANTRVRIEGNTDNVGARQMNMNLSKKRAQAVANYLVQQYGIDPNRFVIIGNGPDRPTPGCETNATEACKAKNRRTEFQLISD